MKMTDVLLIAGAGYIGYALGKKSHASPSNLTPVQSQNALLPANALQTAQTVAQNAQAVAQDTYDALSQLVPDEYKASVQSLSPDEALTLLTKIQNSSTAATDTSNSTPDQFLAPSSGASLTPSLNSSESDVQQMIFA